MNELKASFLPRIATGFAFIVLAASACGPIKDVSDTKKTTEKMSKTMDHLSETTDGVNDKTGSMGQTIDLQFVGLRSGDGSMIRDNALEKLKSSSKMADKLKFATKYFLAFEFQLFKNTGADSPKVRDVLFGVAMEEFTKDLISLMPNPVLTMSSPTRWFRGRNIEIRSYSPWHNEAQNIRALSAALHKLHVIQQIVETQTGEAPVSMFDLIKGGLEKRKPYAMGEITYDSLKTHERWVIDKAGIYEYLLQMRASFLASYVLGGLHAVENHKLISNDFANELTVLFSKNGWAPESDFTQNNEASLRYYSAVMNHALEALDVLGDAELSPTVDHVIAEDFRKLKIVSTRVSMTSPSVAQTISTLESQLKTFTDFDKE